MENMGRWETTGPARYGGTTGNGRDGYWYEFQRAPDSPDRAGGPKQAAAIWHGALEEAKASLNHHNHATF